MLGTMWRGIWRETEVAARVLSRIADFVKPEELRSVMEAEVSGHQRGLGGCCIARWL